MCAHPVILIHSEANPKPAPGAPCNGCGVCCLLEPCPLGVLLSRKRQGACAALRWVDDARQYRCGALITPLEVLQQTLPRPLQALASTLAPLLAGVARRSIAQGLGCDSTVQVQPAPEEAMNSPTMQASSTPPLSPP